MDDTADASACRPGCKCELHFGLAEFMEQLTGKDYGLARAPLAGQEHRLNVQTIGPSPTDAIALPVVVACDGSYTCPCIPCRDERLERHRASMAKAA